MNDEHDVSEQETPEPVQDADEAPASAPVLSRDDILGADDMETVSVDVPQWGGPVLVRAFSGRSRDRWNAEVTARTSGDDVDQDGLRAILVILTAVDADGALMFTDDDREALQGKSAAALDLIFPVAAKINGLFPETIEEMVGNSSGDTSDDSGSR